MTQKIFIFDMDGVLLSGEGYRKSFEIAIQYLCKACGFGEVEVGDHVHSCFESIGISSEWEMTPLYFALLLDSVLKISEQDLPVSIKGLCHAEMQFPGISIGEVNDQIFTLKPLLIRGQRASSAILIALTQSNNIVAFSNIRNLPIFTDLLRDPHNLASSLTCQLIQNLTAGSKDFRSLIKIEPFIETESVLKLYDHSCLSDEKKVRILEYAKQNQIHSAICTARPSLAPEKAPLDNHPYFPEAEMGRELLGLEAIPLVGWGGMQSLAARTGRNPTEFLKPQPVQTLAAVGSAMGMEYWESLKWALWLTEVAPMELNFSTRSISNCLLSTELNLSIFEDMENGLIAAQNAKSIIEKHGGHVNLQLWGITKNHEKEEALRVCGAQIVQTVNDALEFEI